MLLRYLIRFISNSDWPYYYGFLLAFGFFVTGILQSVLVQYYFFLVIRIGQRIKSSLVTVIYKKSFTISSDSRNKFTTGEIVNHMSIDSNRIRDLMLYLHAVWSTPLQIIISLFFLLDLLGIAALTGFFLM